MTYNKFDVYHYYLKRNRYKHEFIKSLWACDDVRRAIALYMRSGLPLAAATVYVAHAWAVQINNGPPGCVQNSPLAQLRGMGLDRGKKHIVNQESEIVNQLARYVEYQKAGVIEGLRQGEVPPLAEINYPRPLEKSDSRSLLYWLKSENVEGASPGYADSWTSNRSSDYADYLAYWIKSHWHDYADMFDDAVVAQLLDSEFNENSDIIDTLRKSEESWDRTTPFLTPDLRMRLLLIVVSELNLGLVSLAPSSPVGAGL